MLHTFVGGPGRWMGLTELSDEQVAELDRPPVVTDGDADRGRVTLDDADRVLFAALAHDGRAGYPELARAVGRSESTVRRRVEQLRAVGALYYDVEILPVHLGFEAEAQLSATVAPADVEAVGRALARHPEIPFAAATTGISNLAAVVVCKDLQALYEYMTVRIGELRAVVQLEVIPALRAVKRAGLLTDGRRLFDPPTG